MGRGVYRGGRRDKIFRIYIPEEWRSRESIKRKVEKSYSGDEKENMEY